MKEKTGFASQDAPHMLQYSEDELWDAWDGLDMTADAFLFRHTVGKERLDYACNFMGQRTTFNQLDQDIDRVARALYGFGVRQGDYVSLSLPNVKESIVYNYACWRIGAISNLIDPRTNGLGIAERVNMTNSKLLVTIMNICDPKIDEVLDKLPTVVVVSPTDSLKFGIKPVPNLGKIVYGIKKKKFAKGRMNGGKYIFHTDFIKKYTYDDDIKARFINEMPAAVMYTSGTSSDGMIKGAVHTHESMNAMIRAYKCSKMHDEHSRGLTFGGFIPFFAAYGVLCGMHASLLAGCEIILVPIFDPNKFAEMVLRTKPNIFMGVPRFFEQLARHPKLQQKNNILSFIRIPASGGDKITPASLAFINKIFAQSGYEGGLRVGYGSTELGGSISVMQNYLNDENINWQAEGNVGYLLPNCRAMVIDPDTMEEVPYGVDGELCVNSRSMMKEYWGMPEQTAEITHYGPDGTKYYRMGDKGHMDENGIFYFVDRYKRSIMRPDGHTVHPSPIENAISTHEAVHSCAVVGLQHIEGMAGVIPSAFVVLRGNYPTAEDKLNALKDIDMFCLKVLPERDRAIAYKVVEELPYTPMGKIHFRELEKEPFKPEEFYITDYAFFPELKTE